MSKIRQVGWYGNFYWSGEQWSTLARTVAGHRIVGHGKTRDQASKDFAQLTKEARKSPVIAAKLLRPQSPPEVQIKPGDQLVNPLREPFLTNGLAPVRQVVAVTHSDILLNSGQSVPLRNEQGRTINYRRLESVPEKYLKPADD